MEERKRKKKTEQKEAEFEKEKNKVSNPDMMTTTKLNKSLVMKGEQYESIHRGR